MAAGLGAAVITGTATAGATTGETGAAGSSTSSNQDADASKTPAAKTDSREVSEAADDEDTSNADDTDEGQPQDDDAETAEGTEIPAADEEESPAVEEKTEVPAVDDDAEIPAVDDDTEVPAVEDEEDNRDAASSENEVAVKPETAVESPTAAVTLKSTTAAITTAAAEETDPVLIAAATSTRVTIGSMIVDVLYSWGIRSSKMGTNWLDIPVSQSSATRWLAKRAQIYRNVVIPTPSDPSTPPLLWETNFSSMEEALQYWGLQTGRWGQSAGENQYYTDGDNIYIDAQGNLVIDARREATPDGLGAPNNYTSARVVTMGKQSIGVGTRVVARIQMPVTKGVLPAFWSVGLEPGHEYDWPRQGEIDIVEIPGMGTPAARTNWTGNIHGPSEANNTVDVKLHTIGADLGVDLSQGFHDYGMDWYSDRIVWHVDGVEVGRVTQAQYEAMGGDWTPFSGAWDHYLILNVAVGNPWTGDPSSSVPFQAEMKVDWVKAYDI